MAQRTKAAKPSKLKIEYVPIASLTPDSKNVRRHKPKQITKLSRIIDEFGWSNPIVIDESGMILAGHARLQAAQWLRMTVVPCIRLAHLTPAQKRALAIADNKLTDESTWDDQALRAVLIELTDLDFDLELTGFDVGEIDFHIDGPAGGGSGDPADTVTAPSADQPAISRIGDLWLLCDHRLLCADALDAASYERLLGGKLVQMAFTDPPYNVRIRHNVSGRGRHAHREFPMASGEMSDGEFRAFLAAAMGHVADHSVDGSIHFWCVDWRHVRTLLEAGEGAYSDVKNICVWCKTNAGMGSLYRSQHEFVVVFKSGSAPHQNNVELGKHGRNRSNVWEYAGANVVGAARDADLAAHPTVKPMNLIADSIRDCSKRGGIILDVFVGSGTTILAAERTGRRAAAMEIDPLYVDTAIRRWQTMTGKAAVLADDGRTFEAVAEARLGAATEATVEGN